MASRLLTSFPADNESYKKRASKLMGEVRKLLDDVVDPLEKLELVDTLQRLGLGYKFEDEIKKILKDISADFSSVKDNLNATAVGFRLLRQHGYNVNQGSVLLAHSYLITDPITKEGLQGIEEYDPNIVCWSSIILRLADDLGTSPDEVKRGDTPKSIQCHMHESGVSEEEAREHIRKLIDETWKKMNKDRITKSPFSENFIEIAQNLARVAQFIYQYGDGHGIEDGVTKDRVLSLFIHPIPLPN
ncbi:hypothetical protein COLO4_22402 [Corchorus olitorius]|uniref:Uncharacterized protein n=1 Tax=Corchorus olitorius TaxID=93759 RepID=A0A1R3IM41_9ROSI|nr:hypothetical protein COLO4_22402 [Corchorus olitorius]